MNIVAISGGLSAESSTNRLADRLLDAVIAGPGTVSPGATDPGVAGPGAERGAAASGPTARQINLRELGHDLVNMATTGMASPVLEDAMNAVLGADGIVAAAPVYNAAPVGLFTLFLQLLPQRALAGKPVLLAATGGSARHSLALDAQVRPVIAYLKGLALPTVVFAATEDWGAPESLTVLRHRIAEAAAELRRALAPVAAESGPSGDAAYTSLAPTGSRRDTLVDGLEPAEVTPFEQLLNG